MESPVERLEITNGKQRAVFVRGAEGWAPKWFYLGETPMLRFKDHEWLSLGHVKPAAAAQVQRLPDGGAAFSGVAHYGRTAVAWTVTVRSAAPDTGFSVECSFTPAQAIELLEAFAAFETPYEYDGKEEATTVIGMNPVVRWRGKERISPPVWEHPAWVYSRPQAVRCTGPCHTPLLCHALTHAKGVPDRFVTLVGDWTVCKIHDVYVTPTRNTPNDPDSAGPAGSSLRGYKYIAGALNWSSAWSKDPNVLFEGGCTHRQRVLLDYAALLPGGEMDVMLCRAWERAAACSFPADGHNAAWERAGQRGVTWQAAVQWLRGVFLGDGLENLYLKGKGICTYAVGSRPKAGGDYSWYWWPQWTGGFHYRALLSNDHELAALCDKLDESFAGAAAGFNYQDTIGMSVTVLPALWWLHGPGRHGVLSDGLRRPLRAVLERSVSENGRPRQMDFGSQAATAEAFILASDIYTAPEFMGQARVLLDEINEQLDGHFWAFNVGRRGNPMHGGQVRPLGHGHAVVANLLAHRASAPLSPCGRGQWEGDSPSPSGRGQGEGQGACLKAARRFARYMLAICYATHNGSQDPDFDWRGWANGSNAGRDQIAEFPPWETQNGLLCLAALADEAELEGGCYDALWYIARTGLAQFPAARALKRILDQSLQARFLPREQLASERDFYDNLPYLAYENPHDQTLLASYQGTDCLLGELVWGGGLARAGDARLGVIVPRAALLDERELSQRRVLVWNPLRAPLTADVTVTWPDGATARKTIEAPPRKIAAVEFAR
ncbi:MAG: hypothetical protein ABSE73_17015 [Planctomycetota bacterium]